MYSFQSVYATMTKSDSATNQDAIYVKEINPDFKIVVICDGCGDQRHSDVGAKLGSKKLSELIYERVIDKKPSEIFWKKIKLDLLKYLKPICGDDIDMLFDYLLFTIVGLVIKDGEVCIFNIGDGVRILNGKLKNFGPFPENAPPYISYSLFQNEYKYPELLDFQTELVDLSCVDSLIIGTDGFYDYINLSNKKVTDTPVEILSFNEILQDDDDYFFQNSDSLRRHLNKLGGRFLTDGKLQKGLLKDDTTVFILRNKSAFKKKPKPIEVLPTPVRTPSIYQDKPAVFSHIHKPVTNSTFTPIRIPVVDRSYTQEAKKPDPIVSKNLSKLEPKKRN